MATRAEIRSNIENTREHISYTVDEISDIIHKKVNLKEKIRENPYGGLLIAATAGFVLATFPTQIGKVIFRIAIKSATAAAGAYVSKQGIDYLVKKIR